MVSSPKLDHTSFIRQLRDWFASSLGVTPERKEAVYLELSQSATLRDTAYWLQILFAAGVATLGLTLNSPAVIIGAMLISPLMGPILAAGLALAAGDLVLGLRAGLVLLLSCLAAVSFSVLLVGLLPFREMTGEIAARTQPNTLDLFVALFSGAIGSVAISKEVRGVVTSIPGVAIAVALMPPLCVVGYGIGVALSQNVAEGLRVASGGGLLFLTNLVAITFTAMLVFLTLHLDTAQVRERVREWRRRHDESRWVRATLIRFRISDKTVSIGGAPARLLIIIVPMVLVAIPLTRSLNQLKHEINQQKQENRHRRIATNLWQQSFARLPNGEARSYLDQLTVSELNNKLTLYLRVFTSQPYTREERDEWLRQVAAHFNRPAESVELHLIEIPTASGDLAAVAREERRLETPPTVAQLRASFWQGVTAALRDLRLPPAARLVDYRTITSATQPEQVGLSYLCSHELAADTQELLKEEIRDRFNDPTVVVSFTHINSSFGPLSFSRNQVTLPAGGADLLDQVGQVLAAYPRLRVELHSTSESGERPGVWEERERAIRQYLSEKWVITADRVQSVPGTGAPRTLLLNLTLETLPTTASSVRSVQLPASPQPSPHQRPVSPP